jgi:hypothetical protein
LLGEAGGMSRTCIFKRIDAALEKMRFQGMEVRAIYLDPVDDAAFVKANTRYWRKALKSRATFFATTYRDHFLKRGTKSRIYSTNGVEVAIPKRLSKRTEAPKAMAA